MRYRPCYRRNSTFREDALYSYHAADMPFSTVALYSVPFGALVFVLFRYLKIPSIPGPFLASITDLWRAYQVEYASFHENIGHVHAKYGPIVRVGPNTVYTFDPLAVSTIYSTHGDFKKVRHQNSFCCIY